MYNHTGISVIIVTIKMSSHCAFVIVFDVKYRTLKSINDSVFGLTHILYVASVALQTIYKIVTLACAFGNCILGCIVIQICYFPDWEILVQYWQVLGLVHPFRVVLFGCGIFALSNMSFNKGALYMESWCLVCLILWWH